MQRILIKRAVRDLKENLLRYLALGLLIVMGMYIVVSMVASADMIIYGAEKNGENCNIEDGQFTVFLPLTKEEEAKLTDRGIILEKHFSLDYIVSDDALLRVFENREKIDLMNLDEGRLADKEGEAAIEKRYATEHNLVIGDHILVGGRNLEIVGIGSTPDYDAPLKELSDSAVDSKGFGFIFVDEEEYAQLLSENQSEKAESYLYAYVLNDSMTYDELKETLKGFEISAEEIEDEYFREYWDRTGGKRAEISEGVDSLAKGAQELSDGLQELNEGMQMIPGLPSELTAGMAEGAKGVKELAEGTAEFKEKTDEMLDQYFNISLSKLTMILKADDNPRIGAGADDQVINKVCGLIAGVIVMVLFTYVISVFVIHGIERESSVIGALYALGVKRRDLILHYLMLPVIVTFAAGIIGTLLGFSKWGMVFMSEDHYAYFSTPVFEVIYPPYLILYSIVMPPVVAALVNWFVIRGRLSKTALSLIRNEQKKSRISNVDLGKLKYISRFQVRQMLKEARTGLTVIFGMFFALLVLMLCMNTSVLCNNIKFGTARDTKFEYMYTYKYPDERVPEGGTEAVAKTLKRENLGYNLDVTVLGITKDNPYFEADPEKGEDKAVVSSAAAQKFGLKVGDDLILKDEDEGRSYVFTVTDIVEYSAALYVFMDIDSMRELLGEDEDYFNVVFSNKELPIPSGRLLAATRRDDVVRSASIFIDMMIPMIVTLSVASSVIFCVIMYLMLKVMIDRSTFGISLVKIFGYRAKEIRRLYLDGNFFTVAVGAAITIPLAKKCMDLIYPFMVSNVAIGIDVAFSPSLYAGIYCGVLFLYLIINQLLVRRIKKIVPAEVLKNRE